jgi:FAD dependent oxidoreductase
MPRWAVYQIVGDRSCENNQNYLPVDRNMKRTALLLANTATLLAVQPSTLAITPINVTTVTCDILVVGGGFSGTATAYEALLAGKKVCMTDITDWVGGQVSAQGVSALDERPTQRKQAIFPRGYKEFRQNIKDYYGKLNPGACWVSESCFLPKDGHAILIDMLKNAANKGGGQLKWYPNTVIKDLQVVAKGNGQQVATAIGIQHFAQPGTAPLNTEPLSQTIGDAYAYNGSTRLRKAVIRFAPSPTKPGTPAAVADWYVIEATETGELIALADIPHKLGIDARSAAEPSSPEEKGDRYCTQGFTYPFAMATTETAQPQVEPKFYQQYAPYYSYELKRLADFGLVYSYRRIMSKGEGQKMTFGGIGYTAPAPGDISMQNWTWGNDYRPGSETDNLILDREQLAASGQLQPGGWQGGLRPETLKKGEEIAQGFYYWLVAGTSDSRAALAPESWQKTPNPNQRYLQGLDSPMGTAHGLSKYPYIRESRRIIGRPSFGYSNGFAITETDISRNNLWEPSRIVKLTEAEQRLLGARLAEGNGAIDRLAEPGVQIELKQRQRATVYPDAVGIGHYAIDFHPCMQNSPAESPANLERNGGRSGEGQAYPFQVPLRAMIPQKIDNMLVAGKAISTSHIAAAAYRVQSFEWSVGAAAGTTAAFALEKGVLPYQLVAKLPAANPQLQALRNRLELQDNPTMFPGTSILNNNWKDWK